MLYIKVLLTKQAVERGIENPKPKQQNPQKKYIKLSIKKKKIA